MNGEKVKVSIALNKATGSYEVKSSHPLPNSRTIAGFLPKNKQNYGRSYARDYIQFTTIVGGTMPTITPKEWSEAAAKAALFALEQANPAEVELVNASEGGYLAIGNYVFKLSVADYVLGGQRAMPVLRKRVMDAARAEAQTIIDASQKKGVEIYREAENKYIRKMDEVNKLAEQVRAMQRGLAVTLPPWFTGSNLLFRNHDGRSYLGAWLDFTLAQFVHTSNDGTKYVWAAAPAPPVELILWFPWVAGGDWIPEHLRTSIPTPHTGSSSSCLKLGSTPKLDSADAVYGAANHIRGVLEEVNLNSPYVAHRDWGEGVKAFVPEKLKAAMVEWDKTTEDRLSTICARIRDTADATIPPPRAMSHGREAVFGVPAEFNTEDL